MLSKCAWPLSGCADNWISLPSNYWVVREKKGKGTVEPEDHDKMIFRKKGLYMLHICPHDLLHLC